MKFEYFILLWSKGKLSELKPFVVVNELKSNYGVIYYLIKNSQAVKKGAAPKKAMVKKDVKSKVAAKKMAVMVG